MVRGSVGLACSLHQDVIEWFMLIAVLEELNVANKEADGKPQNHHDRVNGWTYIKGQELARFFKSTETNLHNSGFSTSVLK